MTLSKACQLFVNKIVDKPFLFCYTIPSFYYVIHTNIHTDKETYIMNTREQITTLLESCGNDYISGKKLADSLGLTRAAVWKCINQLSEDGYEIESSRLGYRLGQNSDAISSNSIKSYLGDRADIFDIEVFREIGSTNSFLKEKAALAQQGGNGEILKTWHTVIASAQTAGRGRMGRTFASPGGTGLYLSVLLRPDTVPGLAVRITTAAAVAACKAIEKCTDEKPMIKWVNDIYIRGKKTCGILTEASINLETGKLDWAVMGIGFNVYEPLNGFPKELQDIAGPIVTKRSRDLRSRIAAEFLKEFYILARDPERAEYSEEYKRRSFLLGEKINVLKGDSVIPATVLDIDSECRLIVRYDDSSTEALSSGEVSIKPINIRSSS